MSSFVNFLKGLLSGIFSFLGGIFSSKQSQDAKLEPASKPRKASKSGYFLELEDAKGTGRDSTALPKALEPVAAAVSQVAAAVSDKITEAEPVKAEATAPPSASTTESAKPKRSLPKPAASETHTPAPEPTATAAALNLPKPTVTTFAPNYLGATSSTNGRRRPGANMSSFLDMARQVKTSS